VSASTALGLAVVASLSVLVILAALVVALVTSARGN
jgi:hypothetical protein